MSYPFILWTMQRTGGTALAELLMKMSEHQRAEHEPFNRDRQFGAVTTAWWENRNEEQLASALCAIFSRNYLIKHTYELRGKALNAAILRAAREAGYRHIFLFRQDEFSRLVSKFIAEAHGTWFKDYASKVYTKIRTGERQVEPVPVEKIVAAYHHCRDMTEAIHASLKELGPDLYEIAYEDLYTSDPAARLLRLNELLDFLDFSPAVIKAHEASIQENILGEGQDTRSIVGFVPNLEEVIRALSAVGCEPPTGLVNSSDQVALPLPAARENPAAQAQPPLTARNLALVREFQRLAEKYGTEGPYLEVGPNHASATVLSGDYFIGAEKHGIYLDEFENPVARQNSNDIKIYRDNLVEVCSKFKDGYFATIFSNCALEHDGEFWSTLGEMKRLLAPRGYLMISVPGFRDPKKKATDIKVIGVRGNRLREAVPTFRSHGSTDYWRFSPRALREVILKGLEIEEVRPLGVPIWLIGVGSKPAP